jgi:hypothetical protein
MFKLKMTKAMKLVAKSKSNLKIIFKEKRGDEFKLCNKA